MGELKFRFWNKMAHKFQSPSKYAIDGNGDLVAYDYEMGAYDDPTPFSRTCIIAQQYTGLKDKNDVEIYEGDILNTPITEFGTYEILDFIRGPVTFEDGAFNFYGDHLTSAASKDMTIIGNIFENKDLLEKEQ